MNVSVRLTKVEYEMLMVLKKKDSRYKKGIESKIKLDIYADFKSC